MAMTTSDERRSRSRDVITTGPASHQLQSKYDDEERDRWRQQPGRPANHLDIRRLLQQRPPTWCGLQKPKSEIRDRRLGEQHRGYQQDEFDGEKTARRRKKLAHKANGSGPGGAGGHRVVTRPFGRNDGSDAARD